MDKVFFEEPVLQVISLDNTNVIATSNPLVGLVRKTNYEDQVDIKTGRNLVDDIVIE